MANKMLWQEMTWQEVERASRQCDIVLVPAGSCEQHGPHLPLGTDFFIAYAAAKRVAEKTGAIVAPPIPVGLSAYHLGFPGVMTVRPSTLVEFYVDIFKSLSVSGFNKIICLNGHAGQVWVLQQASTLANAETGVFVALAHWWELAAEEVVKHSGKLWHADDAETSAALATVPNLVNMSKACKEDVKPLVPMCDYDIVPKLTNRFQWTSILTGYAPERSILRFGVTGDATKATREKGEAIIDAFIQQLVEFIEQLKAQYPVGVKVAVR